MLLGGERKEEAGNSSYVATGETARLAGLVSMHLNLHNENQKPLSSSKCLNGMDLHLKRLFLDSKLNVN